MFLWLRFVRVLMLLLAAMVAMAQSWTPRVSGTTSSMRGVTAVDTNVAWACGTGGTYIKTTDGGKTWQHGVVTGAEKLDFRGVYGVDARTAVLLSIGPGDQSRIYKTIDSGANWKLRFKNTDPKGFFDEIAFWNPQHGIALGDPVNGRFEILTTADGGEHWAREQGPSALANEGAFAASNSSLLVASPSEVWFGTGGPNAARVFHSTDGGHNWTVATTPIRNDSTNAGIFSLAFSKDGHGVAVGGDYSKQFEHLHNVAVTSDGGKTWKEPAGAHPNGFRSAVAFLAGAGIWIATGPSGSDISSDEGNTWKRADGGAYNAISFFSAKIGWAVGGQGRLAQFTDKPRRAAQ